MAAPYQRFALTASPPQSSSLRPFGSSEPSNAPIATAPATSASGCFSATSFSLLFARLAWTLPFS